MEKGKWGIIGCADVAEIKSGLAFRKSASSQLLRRDSKKARHYADIHGVHSWYDKVDELLKN